MIFNTKGILFDLGDTLMYSSAPWDPIFDRAGEQLSRFLCTQQIDIDCETFPEEFRQRLYQYYADRERNLKETSTMALLKRILAEKGQHDIPGKILRAALDEFYAVTQTNWFVEEDAISTLQELKAEGYRLGIVSNAGDNRDVLQLVREFGFRPFFDFVLTSATCSYRKPHPRIYQTALNKWGFAPDEVAMVGDRLDADITGSKILGIFAIWIRRRAKEREFGHHNPDAVVNTLSEIPPLLSHRSI